MAGHSFKPKTARRAMLWLFAAAGVAGPAVLAWGISAAGDATATNVVRSSRDAGGSPGPPTRSARISARDQRLSQSQPANGFSPAVRDSVTETDSSRLDEELALAGWEGAAAGWDSAVRLCQACAPIIDGIDCQSCDPCEGEVHWNARGPIPWQIFAQGEYVGPHRTRHVPVYRLRVDDRLEFVYRLTREESPTPYELNVGDTVRVESLTHAEIGRDVVIQPDGNITVIGLGQVRAAELTVVQLQKQLEELYAQLYKIPAITVTPLKVNTRLEDLRAAVDSRYGIGGQTQQARVTPEGTIQLPGIGSVPAQGLTIDELKHEIDERYAQIVEGIEVTPRLMDRAPRFVYVVGEVQVPGRYVLEGPTTVMQSISLAGGWNNGGNLRQVVVFRRAADWHLMATKLDIRGALLGKRPCPADEIWIRDSDIVVVPKSPVLLADDFIELVFTRGIYGVIPMQGISLNFQKLSSL